MRGWVVGNLGPKLKVDWYTWLLVEQLDWNMAKKYMSLIVARITISYCEGVLLPRLPKYKLKLDVTRALIGPTFPVTQVQLLRNEQHIISPHRVP